MYEFVVCVKKRGRRGREKGEGREREREREREKRTVGERGGEQQVVTLLLFTLGKALNKPYTSTP